MLCFREATHNNITALNRRRQIPKYSRPAMGTDEWAGLLQQQCEHPSTQLNYNISSLFRNELYKECSAAQIFALGAVVTEPSVNLQITPGRFMQIMGDQPLEKACVCATELARICEKQFAANIPEYYRKLSAQRKDRNMTTLAKIRPQHAPCCDACLLYSSWLVRNSQKEKGRNESRLTKKFAAIRVWP